MLPSAGSCHCLDAISYGLEEDFRECAQVLLHVIEILRVLIPEVMFRSQWECRKEIHHRLFLYDVLRVRLLDADPNQSGQRPNRAS